MTLVTSYLNFYKKNIKNKVKIQQVRKGKAHNRTIRKRTIAKGLSANKIFIAKGNFKHTNSNVLITLFIYNTEKNYLLLRSLYEFKSLFVIPRWKKSKEIKKLKYHFLRDKNNKLIKDKYNKNIKIFSRRLRLKEYTYSNLPHLYLSYKRYFVDAISIYFNLISEYFNLISQLIEDKIISNDEKLLIFNNKIDSFYSFKYPTHQDYLNLLIKNRKNKFISLIKLLNINNLKFQSNFLYKLKHLASLIYQKKVEFNFINFKKMHLNSNIFTQAVTLKLRNRDNSFYRVFKKSFSKIQLPNVRKVIIQYRKGKKILPLLNKMRNTKINTLFANYAFKTNKDYLNKLLLNFYPKTDNLKIKKGSIVRSPISLTNHVIRSLKHIKLAGIRLEAKGRLTKRFTASRSVFKVRWKGGLKNTDSSFKGLSAVILRGHVKSNVEYTVLQSKGRNGAFGVKGWVSSK